MLLALDTSGPTLSLGLYDGEREHASDIEEIGRGHAERLMPAIERLMLDSDVKPSDLALIAVVVGPGSFMGLRVGVAAARALGLGLAVPVAGVSRLRALARPHRAVHVAIDARRGEVFEQAFDAQNEPLGPLAATPVESFRPRCERMIGSGATLAGQETVGTSDVPRLADVAALARLDPLPPRPLYGRGADAKPQQASILSRSAQR